MQNGDHLEKNESVSRAILQMQIAYKNLELGCTI